MKLLVPNYSCLQNPWLRGLPPPDPRPLCPLSSTEFVEPPSPEKNSWVRHWTEGRGHRGGFVCGVLTSRFYSDFQQTRVLRTVGVIMATGSLVFSHQIKAHLNRTGDTRWRSRLRHCTTSRKVAGSIPDGVIGIFHWNNPSGRTMALGLNQPLTEMSAIGLKTLPHSCADCLEIWEPQPSGTFWTCPGL